MLLKHEAGGVKVVVRATIGMMLQCEVAIGRACIS
jgi:hypothetical protein